MRKARTDIKQPINSATLVPRTSSDASATRSVEQMLPVTKPGDRQEREADQLAAVAMARESSAVGEMSRSSASPNGGPLDPATRQSMESHFSHDFSNVRVHTDSSAAASANALHASAFTVGRDIVFGKEQFQPGTPQTNQLLAHELAHVVQQDQTNEPVIARQMYEERAVTITRQNIEALVTGSYWFSKIDELYEIPFAPQRMSDTEERDAVLSVLWANKPAGVIAAEQVVHATIAPRQGQPNSKQLLYKFVFKPAPANTPNAKPKVEIHFIAEGPGAAGLIAPKPPLTYTPSLTSSYNFTGFPVAIDAYWQQHPDEKRYVFHWVQKQAPMKFDQVLKVSVTKTREKVTTTTETTFQLEGEKDQRGGIVSLLITFLGAVNALPGVVPGDYHAKDFADLLLENAQSKPDELNKDTLGKVNLPPGIAADEQLAVKFYVLGYFTPTPDATGVKVGGTRNAEVDAVVLIPNSTKKILYTFRFKPNNDVDVERVGEMGTGAGQKDPSKLDVARAPEFVEKGQDVKTFAAWLKTRYPRVTVGGSTVDDMRTNINAEAETKADKPEWYENYEIKILNATDAQARMKSAHGYKASQVVDTKNFLPSELRTLELSLETLSGKILNLLKSIRMMRQRIAFDQQPDKSFKENPEVGGQTITKGSNKSIVIFDSTFTQDEPQFYGGAQGVISEPTETFVHEIGHVIGSSSVQASFNRVVQTNQIKPFTRYSIKESTKPREFFAEAFQLFQIDPEWMKTNYPALFTWFEQLTKTGKAPP